MTMKNVNVEEEKMTSCLPEKIKTGPSSAKDTFVLSSKEISWI